jgi:regulatory protein
MPTITNITQQHRRKDRFSIYIDGSYRLSLAQDQLADAALRVGDELADADITRLAQQSEVGKALDRAYNYLSFRGRSRQEMVRYFRRKQYDDELIEFLIQRLEAQDLVNDERFAREWVEARQLASPRSLIHLQAELREKGIASDTIEAAVTSPAATDEGAAIMALITGKRLRQRYPEDQKLIRYLAGKGFRFDAIKAVLEQLSDVEA